jgi:2'-5' RNA ligase
VDLFPGTEPGDEARRSEAGLPTAFFFALRPDAIAIEQILARQSLLCERLSLPRRQRLDGVRLHLTIACPGNPIRLTDQYELALTKAMERLSALAFDVNLVSAVRLSGRGGEFALALVGDEDTRDSTQELRTALADAQRREGIYSTRSRFVPHVTLAYGSNVPVDPMPIPPVRFRAEEVVLIASPQGAGRHIQLGGWRLTGNLPTSCRL